MSNCAMMGDSAPSQNSAHLATRARLDRPLTRRRSSVLSTSERSIAESVPQVNMGCRGGVARVDKPLYLYYCNSTMYLSLDPNSGTPIYLQLKEQMRLAVATGTVQPGERLPVVRELAAQLRINPNTIARVYRELQAEGLLTSRQGSGTFVAEGAPQLAHRGSADLVLGRIRGVIALGMSVGMSLPELQQAFAETIAEAKRVGVVGRTVSSTEQRRDDRE